MATNALTGQENTAQFIVQGSLHIIDFAVAQQIRQDLNAGGTGDVIIGVSPQYLANTYGLTIKDNPVTADYQNLGAIGTIFTFSNTAIIGQVDGQAVPINGDGVQTVSGVSFTDNNGQTFTTVTYQWNIDIQEFSVATGNPVGSTWNQQVVTWAGDNTVGRLIPTTFALDVGQVFVWIYPEANQPPCARANAWTGTRGTQTATDTSGGIMSFTASGFTVTDSVNTKVNQTGTNYCALVMQSAGDASALVFGSYGGNSAISTSGTVTAPPAPALADKVIGCLAPFSAVDVDRVITVDGASARIFSVGPTNFDITLYPPGIDRTHIGAGKTVTGTAGGFIKRFGRFETPTMLVVFGRSGTAAMWMQGMAAGTSVGIGDEAKTITDQITAVAIDDQGAYFTVGADNNVSDVSLSYDWVAIYADGSIRDNFTFFHFVGTGSSLGVGGFGYSPAFVQGRVQDALNSTGTARRSTLQGSTNSTSYTGNFLANNGIISLDSGGATFGITMSPSGKDVFGFALKGTGSATTYPTPTQNDPVCIPNGDGTTSCIDNPVVNPVPDPHAPDIPQPVDPPQWWCNPTLGEAIFQINSPGAGWVACSGPTDLNGWYLSGTGFGGNSIIVSHGRPANPRPWSALSGWSAIFGGSPGAGGPFNTSLLYAASDYTVGTDAPPVRIFDGRTDRGLLSIPPPTAGGTPAKAILSLLAANGTAYCTTWDSGTSSADWSGRVLEIDPVTGNAKPLGVAFPNGQMPYALAWHMGRLWCGTNNGIGSIGKVYFFRPGIDTAWTTDHDVATESAGTVASLASYNGKLYVGTVNAAGSRGKVLVRDSLGAYTVSVTASGGTAALNNGFLQLTVFGTNLYASYYNPDSTVVSKVQKFDGSSWTDSFGTPLETVIRPFIMLPVENGELYAIGGSGTAGVKAQIAVMNSAGTWTDLTSELPETTTTLLPMFGAVVV